MGLLVFAPFQHGRTLYAAEVEAEFFRTFAEPNIKLLVLQSGGLAPDVVNGLQIKLERPASLTLATSAELLPLVSDLSLKLLINQSPPDFITNDHSVAKMN